MRTLIILGAGGHGKVVADIASLVGYENIQFIDDDYPARSNNGHWPIIGKLSAPTDEALPTFVAVGNNHVRERLLGTLRYESSASIIHPQAIVSRRANIGNGVLVVAGAVVNCDAVIGNGVILNTSCTIDHDCNISDFAHISPGANIAGGVSIGLRSWIGIGSAVREGIRIGADCIIGAGSTVVKDVPDGETWVGVPSKATN